MRGVRGVIVFSKVSDTYRTYGNQLIGMVHHRDQQVQQHDNVDQGETTEHDQTPKPDNDHNEDKDADADDVVC